MDARKLSRRAELSGTTRKTDWMRNERGRAFRLYLLVFVLHRDDVAMKNFDRSAKGVEIAMEKIGEDRRRIAGGSGMQKGPADTGLIVISHWKHHCVVDQLSERRR